MHATSALARPAAKRDGAQVTAAIANGEVALRYQPQYAMADGHMVGVEALLRWQHPELGLLGAAPLVTAAARRGWNLSSPRMRMRWLWPRSAAGPLSWPMCAWRSTLPQQTWAIPNLPGVLRPCWQTMVSPPNASRSSLTEQAMLANPDSAAEQLATLRALGCQIAVDDFGTGYSSLALLAQLPLDYLKIDSGFVRAMATSDRDRIVVRAIVELARALGLSVIAEGRE